jgi:two-component system response regulator (stage 0 sporulation protein F)
VSGRRILVVDDHLDLAENIAEILQGAGYETAVAGSAEAALERIGEGDIAALITDFRLPGRNGAELIAELRRRGNDIPAVVMSAYTDEDTIDTAEQAGATEVLAKPVPIPRLMALVEALGREDDLILVVDDNRPLAENVAEVLRSQGYQAIVCTTAAAALSHRRRVRVGIVDYRLPDASGLQVAEALRSRDERVRFLFVSGHGDELREELGRRLPGADAMDKPIDFNRLLSWVARILRHGQIDRPGR